MELPFVAKLPEDFGSGYAIKIEANPKDDDAWFSFTLMEGKQILSNKYEELNKLGIFQIQLRFDEGIAVLNTVGPGASNSTEQRESLSLDKDEKVKIEIRATQNKFKIFLNEELFARFPYREDVKRAKFINFYGCFAVKKMTIKKKD